MREAGPEFADLLLLDDILPLKFSPFRTLEYGHYLKFFNAVLLSTEGWHVSLSNDTFSRALEELPVEASSKWRIRRFNDGHGIVGRLAYITFLHNAAALLPYLTERRLPFILQLYPGGGFDLEQPETDEKLRQVLLSPLCRKVIVTQTVSRDYITERIGCDPDKVEFVYGGVFESRSGFDFHKDKRLYARDKDTIDLCFVAHRYGENFSAKGYDHFVAVARAMAPGDKRLRFHVVGDYSANDLPLAEAADQVTFHGRQEAAFFQQFYPRMDAIISVNRPFAQGPGAFDGFPTGACIEAGFHGVLTCVNDPLNLNIAFTHGKDLVLLDDEPARTAETLRDLIAEPRRLYDLSYATWRAFHEVFDTDRQLWERTRVIARELVSSEALIVRPRTRVSGLDGPPDDALSYWRDQVRSHADALASVAQHHSALLKEYRDLDQRHLDLITLYRDLEQRHEQLMTWYRELEALGRPVPASAPEARHLRALWRGYRRWLPRIVRRAS